jgi:hypothetical protein
MTRNDPKMTQYDKKWEMRESGAGVGRLQETKEAAKESSL